MIRYANGWRSSLAALMVLVLLFLVFVTGAASVAMLTKYVPAIGQ